MYNSNRVSYYLDENNTERDRLSTKSRLYFSPAPYGNCELSKISKVGNLYLKYTLNITVCVRFPIVRLSGYGVGGLHFLLTFRLTTELEPTFPSIPFLIFLLTTEPTSPIRVSNDEHVHEAGEVYDR